MKNDIALIELMEDVPKSDKVQYLCLDPATQVEVNETVYAVGWGSLNMNSSGN